MSIKVFGYELRTPWVKYVDMPIEEEIYWVIRKSVGEDIAQEIESEMEAMLPPVDNEEFAAYRAAEHCAKIARRIKRVK